MDEKDYAEVDAKDIRWGLVHLLIFAILIVAGIVVKRGYGHPEYMMVFHGPAAVFLVVGGLKITARHRRKFSSMKVDIDLD